MNNETRYTLTLTGRMAEGAPFITCHEFTAASLAAAESVELALVQAYEKEGAYVTDANMNHAAPQIVAFNTRRGYSNDGQRIACAVVPGVNGEDWVLFEDVDRHISGGFARWDNGPVTQREVMGVYDNSYTFHMTGPVRDALGYEKFEKLRAELRAAAFAVPGVAYGNNA